MLRRLCALLATLSLIGGCDEPAPTDSDPSESQSSAAHSEDSSAESAIRFSAADVSPATEVTPDNGERAGHRAILETLGSGVALADFDGDAWPDLLFGLGGSLTSDKQIIGGGLRYLRNNRGDGFAEQSATSGVDLPLLYNHGLFATDYDQDGFLDVLVTGYGRLLLYHNLGDGSFVECSESSGLIDPLWSTAAAWGDINGDGADDVYVTNYVDWSFENHPACEGYGGRPDVCSPANFNAQPDFVFLSDGAGGFSRADDIATVPDAGKGLAVLAGDTDLDGDVDFYVANDTTPNLLFLNDGQGQLREVGISSGTAFGTRATADGSMGLELADLTLNGRPDLWVTNYEHQNFALYRNDARGAFQHVSDRVGISAVGTVFVGFGTVAEDFDLDGDEDLMVANGHVMQESRNSPLRQEPLLFLNDNGKRFSNVAETAGEYFRSVHRGRGVVSGDFDGDAKVDLVVTHCNDPAAILRNTSDTSGRLLSIRPVGITGTRVPVGASARLIRDDQQQLRCLKSGASFLSSTDPTLKFAVPDKQEFDATLEIIWSSGVEASYPVQQEGNYVIVEGRPPVRIPR